MKHTDLETRFRNVRVWIVGDIMLDEYIIGSATRISPEAPVPVLDVVTRKSVPGGAANVAANVAALGARVSLTGLAADDDAGRALRALLGGIGVDLAGLIDPGDRCTISKTRIVAGRQQLVRIDNEARTPLTAAAETAALESAAFCGLSAQVAVFSDYAKGLLSDTFCARAIGECRERGVPVIVDPKSHDFAKYRGATVITPNLSEAERAAGVHIDGDSALNRAGEILLRMLPGAGILITRGADGMTLFEEGRAPLTVPTVARQVYDVTGAGDTVVAALAVSLAAGFGMPDAMRIANIAAGIVVDKPGTATTTVAEILSHDAMREQ